MGVEGQGNGMIPPPDLLTYHSPWTLLTPYEVSILLSQYTDGKTVSQRDPAFHWETCNKECWGPREAETLPEMSSDHLEAEGVGSEGGRDSTMRTKRTI